MLTISAILDCQFVFDRYKGLVGVSGVGALLNFLLFEKVDQETVLSFVKK